MDGCRVSIDELKNDTSTNDDEALFEEFLTSEAYKSAVAERYLAKLEDPMLLWEALSFDGFKMPYSGAINDKQHYVNKGATAIYEAALVKAITEEDDAELGRLIRTHQVIPYLYEPSVEDVQENWRDYE